MSLCNVWLGGNRALIATDTAVADATGRGRTSGSKMAVLPHALTVLAVRGSAVPFLALAYVHVFEAMQGFDEMDDGMVAMLDALREQLFTAHPQLRDSFEVQIIAVGASKRADAMAGATYTYSLNAPGFTRLPIEGARIHGGFDAMTPFPDLRTDDGMRAVAARQVDHFRRVEPGAAIGGELHIAEILVPGRCISIRTVPL